MLRRKQRDGRDAEDLARRHLERQGLIPLENNYLCHTGEIDLVMREGEVLVFVEVRLRRNGAFGGALASVDRRKQQRLISAAQHYLQRTAWTGPCRFDVVGMDGSGTPQWVRNAFEAI
jgi:putative endonuclease